MSYCEMKHMPILYDYGITHRMVSMKKSDNCGLWTLKCDVFNADCPARKVLSLLSDKWSLLIIHALSEGTYRTAELRRRIGGISEKMLVQTLRKLENYKLVIRTSYPEVPPRVEYSLTALGISLEPFVRALNLWVETHAFETIDWLKKEKI